MLILSDAFPVFAFEDGNSFGQTFKVKIVFLKYRQSVQVVQSGDQNVLHI